MEGLRIGIIEDEVLTIENISIHLRRMGHCVACTHTNFKEAISQLGAQELDLFLIDIRLKGNLSGLDVAKELNKGPGIPFIFLTSYTDSTTVRNAMELMPAGYVAKPFSYEDLFIAIELAKVKLALGKVESRVIEVKTRYEKECIPVEEVLYLEADRSYVTIHLTGETKVLRQPMGSLLESFQADEMIRIHRSFAVNPRKVEGVTASHVIVAGKKLPLGPGYRKRFRTALAELQS